MRMIEVGCHCVLIVVEESVNIADAKVRRIDYCGSVGAEDPQPAISPVNRRLGDLISDFNLTPDKVRELTQVEVNGYFDTFASLVHDGWSFRELKKVLRLHILD